MATLSSIITPTNITTASNTQTLTNKTITGGILNGTLGATTPSTVAATLLNVAASTRPTITVETTGVTAKGRVFHADANAGGRLDLSSNLSFDGTNWQRDDTGQPSSIISLTGGLFQWRRANTGSNPASLTTILSGSDAGLAVTGTGTTSGNFGAGAAADGTFALLASSTTQRSQLTLKGSNVVGIRFQSTDINGGERNWGFANNIDAQGSLSVRYGASQGADPTTTMAQFSSTGLAVTGTLSATTTITATGSIFTGTTAEISPTSGTQDGMSLNSAGLLTISRNGAGAMQVRRRASDGNLQVFFRDTTSVGSIQVTTTGTTFTTTSDYRLKNITGPLTDSGTFIDALKPKTGTWKSNNSKFSGFLAHEFAEISPSSVAGEKDATDADGQPSYQSMQASSPEVIANLVAELQSLRKRLAALEAK